MFGDLHEFPLFEKPIILLHFLMNVLMTWISLQKIKVMYVKLFKSSIKWYPVNIKNIFEFSKLTMVPSLNAKKCVFMGYAYFKKGYICYNPY